MAVGSPELVKLIHQLTDPDREVREDACGTVVFWQGLFTGEEAQTTARVLAHLAAAEADKECLESELNAINELTTSGALRREDVGPLSALDPTGIDRNSAEQLQSLVDMDLAG